MKAVVCTKYGPPEVLQLKDMPKPVPKNNEVLIKVFATAVSASDCIVRGFKLPTWSFIGLSMRFVVGFRKPRNAILGLIVAGEIEAVGKDVNRFKKSDQVYGFTGFGFGAYAEYTCMPAEDSRFGTLALKPNNVRYEEAAALAYGAILAGHYVKKGNIQKGQKVLIYGASGAIGTTAVQLAKYYGATVTGVCSSSNRDMVMSLGADKVIDYTKEDAVSHLEHYDVVLDAVGTSKSSELKEVSKKALTANGQYTSVDEGSPKLRKENLVLIKELVEAGHVKPVIDRCYPLEEMVEAHRYVDQGHKKGNVVITIDHGDLA